MMDRRKKNIAWNPADSDGAMPSWDRVNLAVLMDIRDEMQTLNRLLGCQNFLEVPRILRSIRRNTAKPRKPKTAAKKAKR